MTAKEYLQQIKMLDAKAKNSRDRAESIRESIQRVKAVSYSDTKTRTAQGERTAGKLGRLEELESQAVKDVIELEEKKAEMAEKINALSNPLHVRLLYLRYVKLMDWEEIAEEMGFTERHIYRMHGNALTEFKKINLQSSKNG